MKLFISTTGVDHFYRLGFCWTREGRVLEGDMLTEAEARILQAEVNLHIRPATVEEIAAYEAGIVNMDGALFDGTDGGIGDADPLISDALAQHVDDIIRLLPAEAFNKDGTPKVEAVRAALPDLIDDQTPNASLVSRNLLSLRIDALRADGFTPPVSETG